MKRSFKNGSSLVLFAFFVSLHLTIINSFGATDKVYADPKGFVAEKYSGEYERLEKDGYVIKSSVGRGLGLEELPAPAVIASCHSFLPTKTINCVFVLNKIERRDEKGHAIYSQPYDMLHIILPKNWSYFDSGDAGCKITQSPNADVIAIGKWSWRKEASLGGFAHSIKAAWLIDYKKMKFVEVSTHGVQCGYKDDRD